MDEELAAIASQYGLRSLDTSEIRRVSGAQLGEIRAQLVAAAHERKGACEQARKRARQSNADDDLRALEEASQSLAVVVNVLGDVTAQLERSPDLVLDAAGQLLAASDARSAADAPVAASRSVRASRVDMAPRTRTRVGVVRASGTGSQLSGAEWRNVFAERIVAASRTRGELPMLPVLSFEETAPLPYLCGDARTNESTIDGELARRERVLRASGGSCAPTSVDFSQPFLGTDLRPVRDALPRFSADRGGVRLIPPPTLSDLSSGVGVWEYATDVTPGQATKSYATLSCPNPTETFVDAIYSHIRVGNFRQLFWAEQVDAWLKASYALLARTAEERLITTMQNGSTVCVENTTLGTCRDVLTTLDRASAGHRNRMRLSDDTLLRLVAPQWLKRMMRADLVRQAYNAPTDFAIADASIDNMIRGLGINVTWSMEWPSMDWSAQVDGALNG